MERFTTLTGVAVPLTDDDVNTDQIAPVLPNRQLNTDYAELLFARQRLHEDGTPDPAFVLNKPQFARPAILVTGRNFGCGSSRESAVWALMAVGIRCLVGRSFADFFRENCLQNGVLPVTLGDPEAEALMLRVAQADGAATFTVDLEALRIAGPGGPDIGFEIPPADRMRLLEGLDDIGLSMKHAPEIEAWEKRSAAERPWLQTARDARL